jgi:methanogenic corrinoid protein MtbC1
MNIAGGLNIAALSRRTGVAPDTLRKWEQRYGILRPTRTPGGQRRYAESDVARVEWLRARLGEGYRIGEAAMLLGSADAEVARTPPELREALIDAASRADEAALGRLLDQTFVVGPLEQAFADVVRPVLERVGADWADGACSVAQEHLVSCAVRARLDRLLADARGSVRGTAVLACPPGERHDLGLLMLAVLLRADGWHVVYLGADTPTEDVLALAERISARLLCFSCALKEPVEALGAGLEARGRRRGATVVVGGAAVTPEVARKLGARYGDDDLRRAVPGLRRLAAPA